MLPNEMSTKEVVQDCESFGGVNESDISYLRFDHRSETDPEGFFFFFFFLSRVKHCREALVNITLPYYYSNFTLYLPTFIVLIASKINNWNGN